MLRILVMGLVLVLLALPFLPIRLPVTLCGYNFPEEKRYKNLIYIAGTLVVILATVVLMPYILNLANWFAGLKPVKWLLDLLPNYARYGAAMFRAVFANLLFSLVVLLVHGVGGGLGGLFRLLRGKPGSKEAREKRREARRQAREAKKQARAAQKAKKDQDEAQKEEDEQTPPPEAKPQLPPELLPRPEQPDLSGRITIPGRTETGKKPKPASRQGRKQDGDQPEDRDTRGGISPEALARLVIGLFYEKREDGWYVLPQCKKVAKHLRNFLVLAGLAYLVLFTLLMIPVFFPVERFAKQFYGVMNVLVDNCYLYPTVSLVLLTELFWFMNGREPEEEPAQAAETWSRQKGRIVDLDKVEQDLIQSFGEKNEIKSFYTGDVEGLAQTRAPVDVDADPLLGSISAFVEGQGLARNDDYLRGIQALQQGRHTLFDAPLYTAAGMYLYAYLNMRISQGERIVVVCQDEGEIPAVIQNLQLGFQRAMRTHAPLWQIADRKNLRPGNQTDVLVLTPRDFRDDDLYKEGRDFFPGVTMAMLPDADRVVMANNYYCLVMAERLRQCARSRVQYLFLSTRHTLNLAGSLTQYFLLDQAVHTVQAEYAYGSLRLYVWKTRNDGATLLDNGAQTVQMEVGIAQVARRNGIPNINLVSGSAIFPSQVNPQWLDVYDATERPIGFAVVADDGFNLPGVIYAYSRYMGKQASVLHVICRPYLLRDYFFANAVRSLYEQPLMERGVAEHAELQRSGLILLLCRLMQGIPVAEFAAQMQHLTGQIPEDPDLGFPQLKKLVEQCMEMAFGPEAARHAGFRLTQSMDPQFHRVRIIQIQEQGILDRLLADTALVTLRFSGGRPDAHLSLFRKMLDQRYLVGQNLIYDHQNYEVRYIDRVRGIIHVDDANAVHNVPDDYIQVRHYTLQESETFRQGREAVAGGGVVEDSRHVTGSKLEFQGDGAVTALHMVRSLDALEITSDTVAYYPVHGNAERLDLTDSTVVAVRLNQRRREELRRTVGQALYLKLEGDFQGSDRLTMTLAVLLQEMMKTLFPEQYFCLAVCPVLERPQAIYEHSDRLCRQIAGMYPRLLGWKKPEPNSIELLIVDDCQGGTGVLDMLYSQEGIYLCNVLDMLGDYLEWQKDHEEGSYFYFGAKELPAIYDLGGLRELLQVFRRRYVRSHDLFRSLQSANCCEFCGKPLDGGSYLWDNRRNICQDCVEEHKPTQEEAAQILTYAAGFLKDRFGVKLPEELTVAQGGDFREKDVSGLDVEAGRITLAPELPLTVVHSEILCQLVRLWQLENLRMTGEPEFDGQVRYVLLQYLEALEQHQRRRRLHRRALLGTDDASQGYCSLRQELQKRNTDNSFAYMLEVYPKGSQSPVRKTEPKKSTRKTGQATRYFYEQLAPELRPAYDRILQGLMDMEASIPVEEFQLGDQLEVLWDRVLGDHPEIFWLARHYSHTYDGNTGIWKTVKPAYSMDAQERQRRQGEIDQAVPRFLEGITQETGDYRAALTIYERLAQELDYDSLALERQTQRDAQLRQQNRRDDGPDDLRSIYGALVRKRAVCAGYAVAFQYLLQQLGMECLYVRGHCTSEGYHAWNIARVEGDYYHVDVTWGDRSNTDPNKSQSGISYNYFCLPDGDIRLSRDIDPEPAAPACTATACNYFVRHGLLFTAYDHRMVKARLLELLADPKTARLDLRFANGRVMEAARQHLVHNGGLFEILQAAGRTDTRYTWWTDERLHVLSVTISPGEAGKTGEAGEAGETGEDE